MCNSLLAGDEVTRWSQMLLLLENNSFIGILLIHQTLLTSCEMMQKAVSVNLTLTKSKMILASGPVGITK